MLTPEQLTEIDQRISVAASLTLSNRLVRLVKPKGDSLRGRKPSGFSNELTEAFLEADTDMDGWPIWIDDILSGVCRLDWYRPSERSIPLSARKLFNIFSALEWVSVYEISHHINVGERLAQYYMKACEIAYPHLLRSSKDSRLTSMRYPEIFVYPRKEEIETITDRGEGDVSEY